MKTFFSLALGLMLAAGLAGCGNKPDAAPANDAKQPPPKHHHEPPHGGTAVELGEEEAHLELVLDAASGKLTAYALDAHMGDFVRLTAPEFTATAKLGEKTEPLVFKAIANTATGEKVGDTAQFEAQADWLKTTATFDGVLKELEVRGKTYTNVTFNFPKGNDQ